VADKWRVIGIYLEIPDGQLRAIGADHHGDPQECLIAMLTVWLSRHSPPPTWEEITEALEFVGYAFVAHNLREKFCECHTYSLIKCR